MLNPNEEWRDVVNFEGYYEVSSLGRVRNTRTQAIKAQCVQSSGKYVQVQLWKNNKHYGELVHRLVAQSFIYNPLGKPQVNHLNKDDKDNRASNLEWLSCAENHQHAFANGRKGVKSRLGERTSLHSRYRYIYWNERRQKWSVTVKVDGKTYNAGRYDDELTAAIAADAFIDRMGWDRRKNFS